MVKARAAAGHPRDDGPRREGGEGKDAAVPILALLNERRHYGQISEVRDYVPWSEKRDAVVFRGHATGDRREALSPYLGASFDFAFTDTVWTRCRPRSSWGTGT